MRNAQGYCAPRLGKKTGAGIGLPVEGGDEPRCSCSAAFLSSGVRSMAALGGGRKAAGALSGRPTRSVAATRLVSGSGSENMNEREHTMTDITLAVHDGRITTTSRQIAEHFGKRHDTVLRAIANLECSEEFSHRNFAAAFYTDEQGKPRQEYTLTRDGFTFLCMGFTGRDAAQWKERYIAAFDAMEAELAKVGAGGTALPAPTFDLRATMLEAGSTPTVPLPPDIQQALEARAMQLTLEAHILMRDFLARRVAYTCVVGQPRRIMESKALETIAETTLDMALAPKHYDTMAGLVGAMELLSIQTSKAYEQMRSILA